MLLVKEKGLNFPILIKGIEMAALLVMFKNCRRLEVDLFIIDNFRNKPFGRDKVKSGQIAFKG